MGVAPENLEKIFQHDFTTKAKGHGFGLHTCGIAAQELGGTLNVESDGLGKGATFTLQLPLATASKNGVDCDESVPKESTAAKPFPSIVADLALPRLADLGPVSNPTAENNF